MVYGYIRVSTDRQTVENQRFEIRRFAKAHQINIDLWVEESISGIIPWEKRALGTLLQTAQANDTLLCSELSRLGRTLFMILEVLNHCLKMKIRVCSIKDGFQLEDDLSSKVIAFAFGLSAEIERNLISQRTREALARKRAGGQKLGRPKGMSVKSKLSRHSKTIRLLLERGYSFKRIAKRLNVHPQTLRRFLQRNPVHPQPLHLEQTERK